MNDVQESGHFGDPKSFDPALDPELDRLSRRALIGRVGSATLLAAAIADGVQAQEDGKKVHALDDPSIKKRDIDHHTSEKQGGDTLVDVHFKGFLAEPQGDDKRPGVIIIQEIFGLTDHIKDVACRFAQAGYTALAPNLFTREGAPPPLSGGFQPLMEFVGKIPDSQILGDLRGAIQYLRHLPTSNGKVGSVGFCWGGRFSMLLDAEDADLNAAVAYYGRISGQPNANQTTYPLDVADKMHSPLLGHFGAEDQGIPPSEVEKLRAALKANNKTAELYIYEHAGHAFNNDTRESYRPDAAKLSYKRTLDWFDKYLKK